jgi:multicomponent Na+:H+ antiporter subunit C
MILFHALLVGVLFGAAVYFMLRRSIVKLVFGLILLSQATHLFLFVVGDMRKAHPPILAATGAASGAMADPLPQALILTAIVISFGVLAFTLVLMHRAHETLNTDDLHQMKDTDR